MFILPFGILAIIFENINIKDFALFHVSVRSSDDLYKPWKQYLRMAHLTKGITNHIFTSASELRFVLRCGIDLKSIQMNLLRHSHFGEDGSDIQIMVTRGCTDIVHAMLHRNKGIDINKYMKYDSSYFFEDNILDEEHGMCTLLHIALKERLPSMVQLLLDYGGDINLPVLISGIDYEYGTPLLLSIPPLSIFAYDTHYHEDEDRYIYENIEMTTKVARVLLKSCIDAEARTRASIDSEWEFDEVLEEEVIDEISATVSPDCTPLQVALRNHNKEFSLFLCENGAVLDPGLLGTYLCCSIHMQSLPLVKIFYQKFGKELCSVAICAGGNNSFMCACSTGATSILSYFLDKDIDTGYDEHHLLCPNLNGLTPIQTLVEKGHTSLLMNLLKRLSSNITFEVVNSRDKYGNDILLSASKYSFSSLKFLLEGWENKDKQSCTLDAKVKNGNGHNILMLHACSHHASLSTVKELIDVAPHLKGSLLDKDKDRKTLVDQLEDDIKQSPVLHNFQKHNVEVKKKILKYILDLMEHNKLENMYKEYYDSGMSVRVQSGVEALGSSKKRSRNRKARKVPNTNTFFSINEFPQIEFLNVPSRLHSESNAVISSTYTSQEFTMTNADSTEDSEKILSSLLKSLTKGYQKFRNIFTKIYPKGEQ